MPSAWARCPFAQDTIPFSQFGTLPSLTSSPA